MMPRRIIVWRFVFVAYSSRCPCVITCPNFFYSLPAVVFVSERVSSAVCLHGLRLHRRVVLKVACVGVRSLPILPDSCDEHILVFVIGVGQGCAANYSF